MTVALDVEEMLIFLKYVHAGKMFALYLINTHVVNLPTHLLLLLLLLLNISKINCHIFRFQFFYKGGYCYLIISFFC